MSKIRPNISIEYTEDATIAVITKEKLLEEQDIRSLEESIKYLIEQADRINLIIDFRNVKFLSSAVLGLLISISKRVYDRQGKLRLCNITPHIYEIFKITRLINVFDIYADLDGATADLSLNN